MVYQVPNGERTGERDGMDGVARECADLVSNLVRCRALWCYAAGCGAALRRDVGGNIMKMMRFVLVQGFVRKCTGLRSG